jgi:hypothetical protein
LGKWIVTRIIPTRTIACWDDAEARTLLRTEIEYSQRFFRWKSIVTKVPVVSTAVVTAQQFHDENSGRGANSSQVTFSELGITADRATEITIQHPPANITGETVEIPGDKVLVKSTTLLVFAVCNVYFEAKRISNA